MFEKKSKFLPITTLVGLIVSLLGGLTLIPVFGIYGACILIILIQFFQLLTAIYFVNRIKWFNKGIYNQGIFYIGVVGMMALTLLILLNDNGYFSYLPILYVIILLSMKYKSFKNILLNRK